ncbi:MAG: HDOD domain-containing protein [Pseudomonadales bacterium]|nr:HDOD domain-containing protein [Pseudomonadales bacterium]
MQKKSITLKYIRNFHQALADNPAVLEHVVSHWKLPATIDENDAMPTEQYIGMLRYLHDEAGITDIGLRLGDGFFINYMGTLGLYLYTCEDLQQAIQYYHEYFFLESEFNSPHQFHKQADCIEVIIAAPQELHDVEDIYKEMALMRIIRSMQQISGSHILPKRIELPRCKHDGFERLGLTTLINPKYKSFKLIYDQAVLSTRLPASNSRNRFLLKEVLDDEASQLQAGTDIFEQLYRVILSTSTLSSMSLEYLADQLCVSERTVNRRLKEAGISFRGVLNTAKRMQAVKRLASGMDIISVAEELGFSDRSSFERAFKAWLVITPTQFKAIHNDFPSFNKQYNLTTMDSMPALSTIGLQLNGLLNEGRNNAEDIAAMTLLDPVLAAKVLGLSHSASFGSHDKLSVQQALQCVFENEKMKTVAIAIISNSSFITLEFSGFDLKKHWVDTYVIAEFCRRCVDAKLIKTPLDVNTIYSVGLFFNLGLLFLMQTQKKPIEDIFSDYDFTNFDSLSCSEALKTHCGLSGFMASAILLSHWGVSSDIIKPIVFMDQKKIPAAMQQTVGLLHCADTMSFHLNNSNSDKVIKALETFSSNHHVDLDALMDIYLDVEAIFDQLSIQANSAFYI